MENHRKDDILLAEKLRLEHQLRTIFSMYTGIKDKDKIALFDEYHGAIEDVIEIRRHKIRKALGETNEDKRNLC